MQMERGTSQCSAAAATKTISSTSSITPTKTGASSGAGITRMIRYPSTKICRTTVTGSYPNQITICLLAESLTDRVEIWFERDTQQKRLQAPHRSLEGAGVGRNCCALA